VASLMVALDILVVSTALGAIRTELGASVQQLEWTVNAYNLSLAVLLITASALADQYGRRRTFATGLALFSLASAGCALAPGGGWLIAGRAVQGVGAALVMPVAVALIGAAFPRERLGWALTLGVLLMAGFVVWELHARHPILSMRFFHNHTFATGNAITFVLFAEIFGSAFLMAQFLQTDLGSRPLESGLQLIPWTGTMVFIAPIAGSLADRYGPRPVTAAGLALATIGWAWLSLIAQPGMPYSAVVGPLLICGIGNSAAIPVVQAAVVGSVSADAAGIASGTNGMARELGGVFGVAILTTVFASTGNYASAQTFTNGFIPAIATCTLLALVGVLISLIPPRTRTTPNTSSPATQHTDHHPHHVG
jgi:MFS family permease